MCCSFKYQERVVRPTDTATVLAPGGALALGFGLRLASGRLVLNARAETVLEKPLFRRLVLAGRVVVPAQCFYEWDRNKFQGIDWLEHQGGWQWHNLCVGWQYPEYHRQWVNNIVCGVGHADLYGDEHEQCNVCDNEYQQQPSNRDIYM